MRRLDRGTGSKLVGAVDRVTIAVLVVTGFALLARLVGLGSRPFHWDEARVGYWTLRYAATGFFEYRPVAGGTVPYLVGRWLLTLLPATDFVARLFVAFVGGLLPVSALLFRGRLRDDETVLLGIVLAASPLLLYYSRFLRGDLPLAAFALVAVGLVIRWIDADDDRYLMAAAIAVALGVASSGFALTTLVVTVIAASLTFDHRRVAGAGYTAASALSSGVGRVRVRVRDFVTAGLVFTVALFVLFVPRGRSLATEPLVLLRRTFVHPIEAFVGVRVLNRAGTELLPFVGDAIGTLAVTTGPLFLVALGGFLAERYGTFGESEFPRPIVAFAGFWAGVGLLAYPIASEVTAPWVPVHVAVPLSIPAAVGLAAVVRYGQRAANRNDTGRVAAAALIVLAIGVHGGVVAAEGVYGPQDAGNPFTHYAQSSNDLESLGAEMARALAESDDARVVWVGDRFYVADETALDAPDVAGDREAFSERLPLAWYVERTGADTESVSAAAQVEGGPAVVIADPGEASALDRRFDEYDRHEVQLRLWDGEAIVFVKR